MGFQFIFISALTTLMAEAGQSIVEHDVDQLPEISNAQGKQEHENDIAAPAGEKRWPGWPGESVFRMLVPAQKVGSIIGRKGEFIKKIVEETRARIKILDGPPGTSERAVISNNFNQQYVSKFEELKVRNAVVSIEHCKC